MHSPGSFASFKPYGIKPCSRNAEMDLAHTMRAHVLTGFVVLAVVARFYFCDHCYSPEPREHCLLASPEIITKTVIPLASWPWSRVPIRAARLD
jgi:hypothetical protein